MRIFHMADAHLGYCQFNCDERARDFARAFQQMCQRAIIKECDLVLIAGDLFHGSAMDPRTFLQAVGALEPLRDEGIDVVAIAGNHDRARTSHGLTWLHALQELGLLRLLEIGIEDGELSLEKALYETDELRVIGIPYVGRALPLLLPQVAESFAAWPRKFTVLMLHAGVGGVIPAFRATLTVDSLRRLFGHYVDYVAIGHIHKPYTPDEWIHITGSLETVSIDEAQWDKRGALIVDMEEGFLVAGQWAIPDRRPFVQLTFNVDDCKTPQRLRGKIQELLVDTGWTPEQIKSPLAPVVTLTLEGVLAFDRSALDIAAIEEDVRHAFVPLLARVRDYTEGDVSEIAVPEGAARADIEYHVVRELVAQDASRKEHADLWTATILDIKDMALTRSAPERIIEETLAFQQKLQEKRKP